MSEAKFTKGPWSVGGLCPSRVYGMQREDKQVLIAETGTVLHNSGANCHLIAAAPEMYEMLSRISVQYVCMDDDFNTIQQLLAKARGESC